MSGALHKSQHWSVDFGGLAKMGTVI